MSEALPGSNWTFREAAHLLNRAGFGGPPEAIRELQKIGWRPAVKSLLQGVEDEDLFPPPTMSDPATFMTETRQDQMGTDEEKRQKFIERREEQVRQLGDLRYWWLQRMRYTTYPLREKMTLFWHGHFASSFDKVGMTYLLWQQNETLRACGLGSFQKLTGEISRDPAMMRYLDLVRSDRLHPNENFARELMELFTLGEGVRYTEKDVRESARAFTGYRINPANLQFVFARRQFDDGPKEFMGNTGNFNGDDIIRIICSQPECAKFIVRKLWAFFAGVPATTIMEQRLAMSFHEANYEIAPVVETIFLSPEFYSQEVVRQQVKGPVQWLMQTCRALEAPLPPPMMTEQAMRQMGQVLFAPPNVKGWEGGRTWINSATFLMRCNLAGLMVNGSPGLRLPPLAISWPSIAPAASRAEAGELCDDLTERLLNASLRDDDRQNLIESLRGRPMPAGDQDVRSIAHLIMSTPEYQLT